MSSLPFSPCLPRSPACRSSWKTHGRSRQLPACSCRRRCLPPARTPERSSVCRCPHPDPFRPWRADTAMRSGAFAACPRTRLRPTCLPRPPPHSSSEWSSSTAAPNASPPISTPCRSGGPSWRPPATGARPRPLVCRARSRPPRPLAAGWPRPSNAMPSSSAGSPPATTCAPLPTSRRAPANTGSLCARLASTAWQPSWHGVSSMAPTARCAAAPSIRVPPRRHPTPSVARRRTRRPRSWRSQTASAPPRPRRWPHSTPSSPQPGRQQAATARLPTCAAPAMPQPPTSIG